MKLVAITKFAIRWLKTIARFCAMALRCSCSSRTRGEFHELGHYLGVTDRAPQLPTRSLRCIAKADTIIRLTAVETHFYNVSVLELAVISTIVADHRPKSIFEIGTFDGRTTLNMWQNASQDTQIYTLDLPKEQQNLPDGKAAGELLDVVDATNVVRLYGNSQMMDFGPYEGRMELVFVDAAHDYESVVHDSKVALSLIRPDQSSTIIWHDYVRFSGVTRAVDELIPNIKQPVEFCRIQDTTIAYLRTR